MPTGQRCLVLNAVMEALCGAEFVYDVGRDGAYKLWLGRFPMAFTVPTHSGLG